MSETGKSSRASSENIQESQIDSLDATPVEEPIDYVEGDFDTILKELSTLVEKEVGERRNHYKRTALRPMALFRIVGVLIILLSVSVPLLAALPEGDQKNVILSIATLSIAGLTGINSFYNWQYQWQSHRQTQYILEHLLANWELTTIKARHMEDKEIAVRTIIEAANTCLTQTREVTASQTSGYFEGVQLSQP